MGWVWTLIKDVVAIGFDPDGNYTGGGSPTAPDADDSVEDPHTLDDDVYDVAPGDHGPLRDYRPGGHDYGEWGGSHDDWRFEDEERESDGSEAGYRDQIDDLVDSEGAPTGLDWR